jgi:hypothetical protein
MLTYRRFPRDLFTGSEQRIGAVKDRLDTTNR